MLLWKDNKKYSSPSPLDRQRRREGMVGAVVVGVGVRVVS